MGGWVRKQNQVFLVIRLFASVPYYNNDDNIPSVIEQVRYGEGGVYATLPLHFEGWRGGFWYTLDLK